MGNNSTSVEQPHVTMRHLATGVCKGYFRFCASILNFFQQLVGRFLLYMVTPASHLLP